nr:hypothetical protein [Candidatus Sigynarchaeota archaeon]
MAVTDDELLVVLKGPFPQGDRRFTFDMQIKNKSNGVICLHSLKVTPYPDFQVEIFRHLAESQSRLLNGTHNFNGKCLVHDDFEQIAFELSFPHQGTYDVEIFVFYVNKDQDVKQLKAKRAYKNVNFVVA